MHMANNQQKVRAQIIKKEQGYSDAEYLEIAKRTTGRTSMTDMTLEEADRFIRFLDPNAPKKTLGEAYYRENAKILKRSIMKRLCGNAGDVFKVIALLLILGIPGAVISIAEDNYGTTSTLWGLWISLLIALVILAKFKKSKYIKNNREGILIALIFTIWPLVVFTLIYLLGEVRALISILGVVIACVFLWSLKAKKDDNKKHSCKRKLD